MAGHSAIIAVGENRVTLWGLTPRERLQRIADKNGMVLDEGGGDGPAILVNLDYVFDPAWLRTIADSPATVLTIDGQPVLANCPDAASCVAVRAAMIGRAVGDGALAASGLAVRPFEDASALINDELRKRDRPFAGRLTPATVRELERASYYSAYKGVTDILTKYLWPEWALALTRVASRIGMSPNFVTAIGAVFCVVALVLFYKGQYWPGMAAGLVFMVLDTVDGKLARCTITSSKAGEFFDHGIDLVHPPFWYLAWALGLASYGRPLGEETIWLVMIVIFAGYIVQRLIEGAFIARFGMHIHVWRPFDSRFRLITARRNPNMVILFVALLLQRPDIGLFAVAVWTVLSLLVHLLQLVQAMVRSAGGHKIESWLG